MSDALPDPVRLPKKGGGDYRLVADSAGWHVSVWTKGEGRRRLRDGTDLADGPFALVEIIVADSVNGYAQLKAAYARLTSGPAGIKRPGFRPGWQERAANTARNEYKAILIGWFTSIAGTIKLLQVARWPTDVQALSTYVESNIPQDLI